ncbi:MAG: bile acid:sodium symporter family protein [Bacteroidales bacterium]|nr:bile acid:sodium symporter family protein [Bacteroidales bacterium]MDT8431816.1 bile acid:sodium symporter family protein [Bacteroidales bacterium]
MANIFSGYFLPVTLAIITLGMGLSITHRDFKNVFFRPRAVIIGICCQILLLPLIAFGVAMLTNIDPYFKVGLVIIAACPGGATSNLVTYLLNGNVALSISMTALNSLITLVSIPVNVSLALMVFLHTDVEIQLNVWDTILKVFLLTVVPAYIGVTIRQRKSAFAKGLNHPLKVILPLILLVVYLGVLFIDEGSTIATRKDFFSLMPYALLLNALSMFLGWQVAYLTKLKRVDRYTIAIEVGLQNSALAIFVASTLLGNREMALVAVVYGSFTFFSTAFFGWGIKRISKEKVFLDKK